MAYRKPLSSRIQLTIIVGVFVCLLPFYYFDRMDLALPSLLAAVAIGCAIATFWKCRHQRWFWSAIALAVMAHVYLIARFPFHNLGVSWLVFGTFALIDYGLVTAFIKLVEIVLTSPEERQEP